MAIALAALLLLAPALFARKLTLTALDSGARSTGEDMLSRTERLLDEIQRQTGLGYDGEVSLVVTTSQESFASYHAGHGTHLPGDVMGVAMSGQASVALNLGLIRELGVPPEVVYKHELCHLVLGESVPENLRPLWFEEGLAQHVSETPIDAVMRAQGRASGSGRDPESLDDVSRMARDPLEMAHGYGHALAAVRALEQRHRSEGLRRLMALLSTRDAQFRPLNFPEAYSRAFGQSFDEFQEAFIASRKRTSFGRIFAFAAQYYFPLLALLAIPVVIFGIKRKQKREQAMVDRWEELDQTAPPDPEWSFDAKAQTDAAEDAIDDAIERNIGEGEEGWDPSDDEGEAWKWGGA